VRPAYRTALLVTAALVIGVFAIGSASSSSTTTRAATPMAAKPIPRFQRLAIARISRMTNCDRLFRQWDRAIDNAHRQAPGKWHDISVSYADAATQRMKTIGC
jgi:hypothetical protein